MPAPERADLLVEKIARFPASPGVYIMKDSRGRTLYVGKAVNLRARVRSYFVKSSDVRVFHRFLVDRVADVDCIVAASETEALLLENNLIKKRRPLFNIRLRDDKSYVCLKVTMAETWPRILVTRRYQNDGNLYFGPFGSAASVREMLRVIKRVFTLRTCTNGFFATRKRPCIEHDIGRCSAPCVGLIERERYLEDVEEVVLFLRGRKDQLLAGLEQKMLAASKARSYELAARYRDQISAIEKVFEVQKAQELGQGDVDVFAEARRGDALVIQEMIIRDGKIVHSHGHAFRSELETPELFASFLTQYYLADRFVPRTILCGLEFPERPVLAAWLREKAGSRVEVLIPSRGDKRRLLEMARENAQNTIEMARSREERLQETLASLRAVLRLPGVPRRIECYDISNLQGAAAVGSMAVFEDGRPERGQYRHFRIKTVRGADDFRMLSEVLQRRFDDWRREPEALPDLVVIDGGKGQLQAARAALAAKGIPELGVIALAKERRRRGTTERVFVPWADEPLPLPQDGAESLLLQHLRDEAHRFAVRYHRQLRKRAALQTGLEGIPGLGERRRRALISAFGTLEGVRQAGIEDLARIIGPKLAEDLARRLRQDPGGASQAADER
jgi:excinuclease ABC subunit C